YVGKDGKPAAYSKDNVPYQAPAHLQMSVEGPKEGDYAMLAGYPGITYRHRTAAEFAGQIDTVLPRRVSVFQQMIDTIEAASA
ncbi:S46 family peptidase, partial [Enterobacter hormaechei]